MYNSVLRFSTLDILTASQTKKEPMTDVKLKKLLEIFESERQLRKQREPPELPEKEE